MTAYVLRYPDDRLALDVCLLFLMASLEVLRVYWGKFGIILFLFRQSMTKKN